MHLSNRWLEQVCHRLRHVPQMRLLVSLVSSLGSPESFLPNLPVCAGPHFMVRGSAGMRLRCGPTAMQPNCNQKKPDEPVSTSMSRVKFSCKSQFYTKRQLGRLKNERIPCFSKQLRRVSQCCDARLLWAKLVYIGCYLSGWLLICRR